MLALLLPTISDPLQAAIIFSGSAGVTGTNAPRAGRDMGTGAMVVIESPATGFMFLKAGISGRGARSMSSTAKLCPTSRACFLSWKSSPAAGSVILLTLLDNIVGDNFLNTVQWTDSFRIWCPAHDFTIRFLDNDVLDDSDNFNVETDYSTTNARTIM